MNILVVTKASWDDRIASGNTLSNFFEGWEDAKFYCIYAREAMPQNRVCEEYYAISPISIIKKLFNPQNIGRRFSVSSTHMRQNTSNEVKLIDKAKRYKVFFELLYNCAYGSCLWKNRAFKKFIQDSNPDIVFCFGQSDPLTYYTLKYVKKNTSARIISYYVDDLYRCNTSTFNLLQRGKNNRLMAIARMSDRCYAISERMCDEYKKLYRKPFYLLHKGCDISQPKAKVNSPIKFVYAGNLFYHRDRILVSLANVINQINDGGLKAHLDIYSGTSVSKDTFVSLNIKGASTLHKARPFDEIKQIMTEADVVLHVESFDEEQMKVVRLSFSTKITDCMQSGSMMLAIGPDSVASIDYSGKIPGCVVVNDLNDMIDVVRALIDNPAIIVENAIKTNEYARKNVEIVQLRNRLKSEFESLID